MVDKFHAAKCKASFYYFAKWAWSLLETGKPFVEELYFKFLCDDIQQRILDCGKGISRKGLIVNLPPAIGKSILYSKIAPVWALIMFPPIPILCASMNSHLALSFSTDSRSLVENKEFQKYFPIQLRDDVNSKNKWMNTAGGSRTSLGLETPTIGGHFWLQILDDPQSMNSIGSEVDRNRINNIVTQHLGSRTGNYAGAQQWVIQQRLSQQDVSAYLESYDSHDKICLPAILNDTCTNPELYIDGLLAPSLLPQSRLDKLRRDLGPEVFAANFLQNPSASDFALIKPEHFTIVPEVPANDSRLYVFFDGALTAKKYSDFSAALACIKHNGQIYIQNIFQRKLEYNQLKIELEDWIKSLKGYDNRTQVYIEPKASGQPIISDLKNNSGLNVYAAPAPTISKELRIQGVSARIANNRVSLLRAPWNSEAIANFCSHTAHDDLLDCLEMAITKLLPAAGPASYKNKIGFVDLGSFNTGPKIHKLFR
jgi:predicted phage terminase large subunit-like protein